MYLRLSHSPGEDHIGNPYREMDYIYFSAVGSHEYMHFVFMRHLYLSSCKIIIGITHGLIEARTDRYINMFGGL